MILYAGGFLVVDVQVINYYDDNDNMSKGQNW